MFNVTFNNISIISWRSFFCLFFFVFFSGRNRSTRRNPLTLSNFIIQIRENNIKITIRLNKTQYLNRNSIVYGRTLQMVTKKKTNRVSKGYLLLLHSWHPPWSSYLYNDYVLQIASRRIWRYQRGNQNPYIEGQTTQWTKEKGQTTIYKTLHIKLSIE